MTRQPDSFPPEVITQLKWYVYRLVDPRNGETFYVGKGKRNRVFQHAKRTLSPSDDEDASDLKFQRIKDIDAAGLEVVHIIHRHGIESEKVALQIEGALIDAYPGLTNQVAGHGSGDYGVRHAAEIIREYKAESFVANERLILINIEKSYSEEGKSVYEAARGYWTSKYERARTYNLILAHRRGIVVGAFRPKRWLRLTDGKRWGFTGVRADSDIEGLYVRKRVPEKYRTKGAVNPVRYIDPPSAIG